jgi:CDP-glycerol glycerophosphotransferase (TagB/SpsB family)
MIETMYYAVPEDKRDKVIILPHPLMAERFRTEEGGLGGSIMLADSYDRVFRDCSLLITDYSSIAYDAFYRGANVAFYWKDKDKCMEHYGEGTYLMLNEDNVFGEVCMNGEDITRAVEELYNRPQRERDLERYGKIVEFHDGRNSERIIERLKADNVIS